MGGTRSPVDLRRVERGARSEAAVPGADGVHPAEGGVGVGGGCRGGRGGHGGRGVAAFRHRGALPLGGVAAADGVHDPISAPVEAAQSGSAKSEKEKYKEDYYSLPHRPT